VLLYITFIVDIISGFGLSAVTFAVAFGIIWLLARCLEKIFLCDIRLCNRPDYPEGFFVLYADETENLKDITNTVDEILKKRSGSYGICLEFNPKQLENWINFMRSKHQINWGILRGYDLKDGMVYYSRPYLPLNTALRARAAIKDPSDVIYFLYLYPYLMQRALDEREVIIIDNQPPTYHTLD